MIFITAGTKLKVFNGLSVTVPLKDSSSDTEK